MTLVLRRDTDCFLCKARGEAEDAVGGLKIIIKVSETNYVVCQVRTEVEETVDNLKIIGERLRSASNTN